MGNKKKSAHISRITYIITFNKEIDYAINQRNSLSIFDFVDGKSKDVTPKFMENESFELEKVRYLHRYVERYVSEIAEKRSIGSTGSSVKRTSISSIRGKSNARLVLGLKWSLDDIIQAIGSMYFIGRDLDEHSILSLVPEAQTYKLPFIKVSLRKTEEILLFEQSSWAVVKGSEEAETVEHDNRIYDYLTMGRGKVRRRSEAETQTKYLLTKTRNVNTVVKKSNEKDAYVSFFEMFDTYQKLLQYKASCQYKHLSLDASKLDAIAKNPNFAYAAMVLERILASNCYHQEQRRYRNMITVDKMDRVANYKYTLNLLYRLVQPVFEPSRFLQKKRKAIAAISFCYGNGDLIAVAYGFYSHSAKVTVNNGNVCIWSMKNPQNPERTYDYPVPVTSLEFSPFMPFLIAIGLYDGTVQVRNITKLGGPPVAVSQRNVLLSSEPVTAIQWISQPQDESAEIDPFLALTRDGKVAKFRIIPSPYLLGMRQMELIRIEGQPEGLQKRSVNVTLNDNYESNRHPCGLSLVMHPMVKDLYFILTDEGCIQMCSLNHTHQYLDALQVHESSVNHMDFSLWSPKLFLTCGNDWTIRIWLEGIFQPLITLTDRFAPVHCAMWSRTHSTVIISLNRETIDIWDLRRDLLAPVSSKRLDTSFMTIAKLSLCGRILAIGNERGNVLMCSFDDMPFPPHAQYAELEKAMYKAVDTSPTLKYELKNIGYFGYEKNERPSRFV
ncbi:WD repeat-containing protein 78-like [Rhagoletis pomonella]|uniref:WD repeat-containing protein 78-like n=1 Tax=Rhagoletis pomonella TaxID=28610 RepID=UPI00177FBA27|nr:WD repeat-containing protein 78-like [Rhagoletis pomonella]